MQLITSTVDFIPENRRINIKLMLVCMLCHFLWFSRLFLWLQKRYSESQVTPHVSNNQLYQIYVNPASSTTLYKTNKVYGIGMERPWYKLYQSHTSKFFTINKTLSLPERHKNLNKNTSSLFINPSDSLEYQYVYKLDRKHCNLPDDDKHLSIFTPPKPL